MINWLLAAHNARVTFAFGAVLPSLFFWGINFRLAQDTRRHGASTSCSMDTWIFCSANQDERSKRTRKFGSALFGFGECSWMIKFGYWTGGLPIAVPFVDKQVHLTYCQWANWDTGRGDGVTHTHTHTWANFDREVVWRTKNDIFFIVFLPLLREWERVACLGWTVGSQSILCVVEVQHYMEIVIFDKWNNALIVLAVAYRFDRCSRKQTPRVCVLVSVWVVVVGGPRRSVGRE